MGQARRGACATPAQGRRGHHFELYEEVLAHRSKRSDPLGYARVLANQANALAHLAVWEHATAKYAEARDLFAQAGDTDAVAVVDRQLEQIDEARGGQQA